MTPSARRSMCDHRSSEQRVYNYRKRPPSTPQLLNGLEIGGHCWLQTDRERHQECTLPDCKSLLFYFVPLAAAQTFKHFHLKSLRSPLTRSLAKQPGSSLAKISSNSALEHLSFNLHSSLFALPPCIPTRVQFDVSVFLSWPWRYRWDFAFAT